MANRTARRGRGFPPRRIVLPAAEGAALRALLWERHGYSAEEAIPALLGGELTTVLLDPGVRARVVAWLERQPLPAEDPDLAEGLAALARQLR